MTWILLLIAVSTSWADSVLKAPAETAVYQSPHDGAKVLFYMHAGEAAEVKAVNENYFRARVRRQGHGMSGYIQQDDLRSEFDLGEDGESADAMSSNGGGGGHGGGDRWAVGAEAGIALDIQSAKNFQTTDNVNYRTSTYMSTTPIAAAMVQTGGRLDFWRLSLGVQQTHYVGTAYPSSVGASSQTISVTQTILSADIKKGWQFFSAKNIYWGLGAELAKVTAVNIVLNGTSFPTSSADQPILVDAIAFAGGHWKLAPSWSIFTELRLSVICDESPLMYGAAAQVGLMYWL